MPIRGSKKIRVDTRKYVETFLCFPGLLSPHKFGQRLSSVLCEKTSHAKAQRDAECYVLLFLCQKSLHRNTQKLCSACFCESLRHLRETITHAVWVLCVPWIPCETPPHPARHYVLFVCNLICTEDARTVRPYRSSDFPHANETP